MLKYLFILIVALFMSQTAFAKAITDVVTKERQTLKTPEIVLKKLKEGNQRFVSGKMYVRDFRAQAKKAAYNQHPVAVVLSCIDSRTPPEVIFDQGIGDIFVTRTAGNVISTDILGGLEFATKLSGAKLIVVLGHSNCGAIKGACNNIHLGNLSYLLAKIQPAVKRAINKSGKKNCNDMEFIDHIAEENVEMIMKQIKNESPIIAELIKKNEVQIVGAIQDLITGNVHFIAPS